MRKNKIVILLVLVIALSAGAGVWKWKGKMQKKNTAQNQTQQKIVENPPSSPKNSFDDLFTDIRSLDVVIPDTKSWHKYEDTNVGFTTKLPKDWIGQLSLGTQVCLGTVDNRYGIEIEGIGFDCPIQIDKYTEPDDKVIEIITGIKERKIEQFTRSVIKEQKVLYSKDKNNDRDYIYFKNRDHYWYMIIHGIKSENNDKLITIANGIISEFESTK